MSQPSIAQQLLAEARQLQAGQGNLAAIRQHVENLLSGITQAQVQFVQDASGNPEVPQETVPLVLEAFGRFQQGLEHMLAALDAEDVDAILEGAGAVDEASAVIRGARDAYQQALAQTGQTPFPFVNRILLHTDHLAQGGNDTRHVVAALHELPEFLEKLQQDILVQEGRASHPEARRVAEAAVAEISSVCQGFYNALSQWDGASDRQKAQVLQQVSERLRAAADNMAQALSAYVETDLASGPTPVLVVNLIFRSFENLHNGMIATEDFRQVLAQGQNAMYQLSARTSAGEVPAAADRLEMVLARMDEALFDTGLPGVAELLPVLQEAAVFLSATASAAGLGIESDDEVLNYVDAGSARRAAGMPENLQHVLDVAQGFLQGQVDAKALLGACDHLDRSCATTKSKIAATPGTGPLMEPLQKGLGLLQEATQSLRTLPQNPDRRVLDAARSLMAQASDKLLELGGMQV